MVTDQDELLASLIEQLNERQRLGMTANVDEVAQAHPEVAKELRELWAMAQFAATFGSSANEVPTTGPTEAPRGDVHELTSFGDYELLGEIGRGGMGVVYRAKQKSLNRIVAIKMMRETRLSSDSDRARFLSEAESVAKLKHPNIVTVFDVGQIERLPYIAMEVVDGQTLSQVIKQRTLPGRLAARLVADVAYAVHHAHEAGIIHRDLKPANILLPNSSSLGEREYEPKVTDFGLAKRLAMSADSVRDYRTQTGAIIGTPGYMAPEQASGRKELTPATDVYALGAILYECLTGRPPFQSDNPVDALMLVIEQEPVPPRLLNSSIDRDLEMICLKCLQKPMDLRYGTAIELARDLEAYLVGEQISSQPSGLSYFLSRMLRETHHIGVLENWGVLWIWHSLATFILCLLTQVMQWTRIDFHGAYLALWTVGLVAWGSILWRLRRRSGPVLFVERQIAHAWAAGVMASIAMFVIEVMVKQPVLTLSPAIAVAAGMVFVFKAGILSGRFYLSAGAMFLTALAMPLLPQVNILLFGLTTALSFLLPGIKYTRMRKKSRLMAQLS